MQVRQSANGVALRFQKLDYARLYASMVQPAFVFDGRAMLEHEALLAIGFRVHSVGVKFPNRLQLLRTCGAADAAPV